MRKWILLLILSCFIIGLTACGSEVTEETIQDVINNTIEASKNIKSIHLSMEIDEISTPSVGEAVKTNIIIEMDFLTDPIFIYQLIELTNISYRMEMYLTEESYYTKDTISNKWVKASKEQYSEALEDSKQQTDTGLMLEKLRKYVDELTLIEKSNFYILSFTASGEKYKDLLTDTISTTLPDDISLEEVLEMLSINYTLYIEKETYYPKKFNIDTDIEIDVDGYKVNTVQTIEGNYFRINEVDAIAIPDEIK